METVADLRYASRHAAGGRTAVAGHYLRKRLRTSGSARRIAVFALILMVVTILVFRFGGIAFDVLETLLALVVAFAAFALLLGLAGLVRVWRHGHAGGVAALLAVLIASLVLVPFLLAGALAFTSPATLTAETSGMADADPIRSANEGPPVEDGSPDAAISGRVFAARAPQIYQIGRTVLGDAGWRISAVEAGDPEDPDAPGEAEPDSLPAPGFVPVPTPRQPADGEDASADNAGPDPLDRPESRAYTVRATAFGPILALPSDVEIHIVEDDAQTYLDLRSTSRFGRRDFGQNRRFIADFLARVDAAAVGIAAPGR